MSVPRLILGRLEMRPEGDCLLVRRRSKSSPSRHSGKGTGPIQHLPH